MKDNIARATFSFVDDRDLETSRAKLSRLKGVHSVGVNVLAQMVCIEYDPGQTTLAKIRIALKPNRKAK